MMMERLNEKASNESITEQIIKFAREYHADDFPNPSRNNCPLKDVLIKTVESGKLPDESLRLHLLNCSPCFQDFCSMRSEKWLVLPVAETNRNKKRQAWTNFFRQPLPALAMILLTVGLLSGALFFVLRESPTTEYAKQTQIKPDIQPGIGGENQTGREIADAADENNQSFAELKHPEKILGNSASKQTSKSNKVKDASPKSNSAPEYSAKSSVILDLSKAAITRNANNKETIYSLRAESFELNIKLPANSPAGIYEISLLDEFGKPLTETKTKQSDGRNLQLKFDLRRTSGRARLCVATKGEIPDCLAVNIGNAR